MKRSLEVISILFILFGALFASYDMFPGLARWNSRHLPVCSEWDSIIKEVSDVDAFVVFNRGDKRFGKIRAIIKGNLDLIMPRVSGVIVSSEIGARTVPSSGQASADVYVKNDRNAMEFVSTADTLVRWIKDFRRNWFLKWGLLSIAFGAFLSLLLRLLSGIHFEKSTSRYTIDEFKLKHD